jgi:hypothetical protein
LEEALSLAPRTQIELYPGCDRGRHICVYDPKEFCEEIEKIFEWHGTHERWNILTFYWFFSLQYIQRKFGFQCLSKSLYETRCRSSVENEGRTNNNPQISHRDGQLFLSSTKVIHKHNYLPIKLHQDFDVQLLSFVFLKLYMIPCATSCASKSFSSSVGLRATLSTSTFRAFCTSFGSCSMIPRTL